MTDRERLRGLIDGREDRMRKLNRPNDKYRVAAEIASGQESALLEIALAIRVAGTEIAEALEKGGRDDGQDNGRRW